MFWLGSPQRLRRPGHLCARGRERRRERSSPSQSPAPGRGPAPPAAGTPGSFLPCPLRRKGRAPPRPDQLCDCGPAKRIRESSVSKSRRNTGVRVEGPRGSRARATTKVRKGRAGGRGGRAGPRGWEGGAAAQGPGLLGPPASGTPGPGVWVWPSPSGSVCGSPLGAGRPAGGRAADRQRRLPASPRGAVSLCPRSEHVCLCVSGSV